MSPRSAAERGVSSRVSLRVAVVLACCAIGSACGAAGESDTRPTETVAQAAAPATPDQTGPQRTIDALPTSDVPSTPVPSIVAPASTVATTVVPTAATPVATRPPPVVRSGADAGPTRTVGDPLRIRIPSLGVDSALETTGVLDDGTVEVPPNADVAGWFGDGPRPGERGPALIMGHVDSARTGPGVFYRLDEMQVGDIAIVDTTEGEQRFVVQATEQHKKAEFPTDEVYGLVPGPALRLVTCGGEFNRSVRSYYDNIIVYLVPEGTS